MFETTNQQKSVFACFWSGFPKVIVLGFTLLSSLNPVDLGHDGINGISIQVGGETSASHLSI